jgi:adenylate cyclase
MHGPLNVPADKKRATLSADFQRALTREILKTELLRVKALIVTTSILTGVLWTVYILAPDQVDRLWHGNLKPAYLYIILVPFILFELAVHAIVKRQIALDQDLSAFRRYIGAFIETSMPTVSLALHIENMGSVAALGFVVPLTYFIFIILSTLRLDFWLSTFTGFVAASQLFVMAMYFRPDPETDFTYHLARSLILLVCGVLAGAVGVQLRRQFETSIAAVTTRDRVTNLFGQHVSAQVVERLLVEGAETPSETRHVAVMFVDFRSFTAAARLRSPQEVVDRLDGAFAVLVEIVDRHGGIVNKFLGDGFLALFGAPLDDQRAPHNAVAAAREMLDAMVQDNKASPWSLRIGIAVHAGDVVAGNVGSPRRKEYTVIGDTVNLAARIESLNKEFGSQLLISAAVHDALGESCNDAVALGEITIRGYEQPMEIWRLG